MDAKEKAEAKAELEKKLLEGLAGDSIVMDERKWNELRARFERKVRERFMHPGDTGECDHG